MQFDIAKAIFAAASVLGAAIPAGAAILLGTDPVNSVNIANVLAAIGGLGALQGLKQPLPHTCAVLIMCLLSKKKMGYNELKEVFTELYKGPKDEAGEKFKLALERLGKVGSIRIMNEEVKLIERVLVRW